MGEVSDETTDANGTRRSEIVGATAGTFVRGGAPLRFAAEQSGTIQNVFSQPLNGTILKLLDYKEDASSVGISTQILPVDNLLLYGTKAARWSLWTAHRKKSCGAFKRATLFMAHR